MPHNPTLEARLPEWNTVLDALHFYRTHLDERLKTLDDESEEYLLVYDDLERSVPNASPSASPFLTTNLDRRYAEAFRHSSRFDGNLRELCLLLWRELNFHGSKLRN